MRVATFAATYTNDVEWPASFWFTEDFDRDELMPPSLIWEMLQAYSFEEHHPMSQRIYRSASCNCRCSVACGR